MLQLPPVPMPQDFVFLLMSNIQEEASNVERAYHQIILGSTQIKHHLASFKEFDEKGRLSVIMSSLGWKGLRDRLASLYVYHMVFGAFPKQPELDQIQDVLDLEQKLAPFTVAGYSRGFLLALYLKMANIHLYNTDPFTEGEGLVIPDQVFTLLEQFKCRTSQIDWLIVMLWQYCSFFGTEEMEDRALGPKFHYRALYNSLTQSQKDQFNTNLLHYGYSINEHSLFIENLV